MVLLRSSRVAKNRGEEFEHGVMRCSIVKIALSLAVLASCSASKAPTSKRGPDWEAIESRPAPSAPANIGNHVPAAPPAKLDPVVIEPESESRTCGLRWNELDEAAPKVIDLGPANGRLGDECAEGFDPATPTCATGNDECIQADM